MTTIEKINSWLVAAEDDLKIEYNSQGRNASGNWEKSLSHSVAEMPQGYKATLLGADYSYWMENGRNPGKFPPRGVIEKWIEQKGIIAQGISNKSLAFLIARKISREGYQGKPVIANVITKGRIEQLLQEVSGTIIGELKSDVLKAWQ